MALSEPDMPFTWGTLRKLLSKTLTSHGRLKTEYTVFQWHLVDRPEDAEVRMPTSTDPRYAPPAVVTRAAVTRALAEKDAECARAEKEQERADRTEREREHLAAQLQALDDERQDELMVADNDFEMVEVQQELQVQLGAARESLVVQAREVQSLREQVASQKTAIVEAKQEGERQALSQFKAARPGDVVSVAKAGGHVLFRREVTTKVPASQAKKKHQLQPRERDGQAA